MTTRSEAYADQFEDLSRQFVALIEGCTPTQMQAVCDGERCTVSALASHIAEGHPIVGDWVARAAAGGPHAPTTMDDIDAMNAEQFARDANRPKHEILDLLRENGAQAAGLVRNLDDATLDRSTYFPLLGREVTTGWIIENILINELVQHPASIRAACDKAITA